MVTIAIETASGKKRLIECPTSIFEMTTELYQKIITDWTYDETLTSIIKLFALMTGQPFADYYDSTDLELERAVVKYTKFIYFMEADLQLLPQLNYFKYGNREIPLPKNLGRLTLAQNLFMKKAITSKDSRSYIAFALAIYLQPLIDGSQFNEDRVDQLEKEFLQLPISQTYQVGFFYSSQRKPYGPLQRLFLPLTKRITHAQVYVKRSLSMPKLTYLKV